MSLNQAWAQVDAGRPREALRDLAAHLSSTPDDEVALCLIAQANIALGNFTTALEAARAAVVAAPDEEWAWRLVSIASARLGQIEDAAGAAATAVELDPGAWVTHTNAAHIARVTSRITDRAFDHAHRGVTLAPDQPEPWFSAGLLSHAAGHTGDAEVAYRATLRLDPQHRDARRLLAVVRSDSHGLIEATDISMDLLAEDPASRPAFLTLRRVALRWLEGVNVILLAGLLAVVLTYGLLRGSGVGGGETSGVLGAEVVLTIAGLAVSYRILRKRLGDKSLRFLRGFPRLAPALLVLATVQAAAVAIAAVALGLFLVGGAAAATMVLVLVLSSAGLLFAGIFFAGVLSRLL